MVVCKYFLQGTCKFGSNCYNEHQNPSNNANFSTTSILRQSNFGNAISLPAKAEVSVDANNLVKSVVSDMAIAERGGQWLFSCYAPFKEKPAFPGFEDTSPEEIRLGYYEAQKNGNVSQYTQQLQSHLQNAVSKIRALQNPSQEIITIIMSIYNTPAAICSGTFGTSTATTSGNANIFGNQANMMASHNVGSSVKTSSNSNVFGNQANMMAGPNIGSTVTTNSNANIFQPNMMASQNTGNIFQSQQTNTNIFGAAGPHVPAQTNIFSNISNNTVNQPQPTAHNIFANQASTNLFPSNQQPTNVFSGATTHSPQHIFPVGNTVTSASPFNANKTIQNTFAPQTPQQNIFAHQPQQQNIPATQTQTPPKNIFAPPAPAPSIFTSNINPFPNSPVATAPPQSNATSIFGCQTKISQPPQHTIDMSIYSKEEELSEEAKNYYQQDVFDIMNIPAQPPTYKMCFDL